MGIDLLSLQGVWLAGPNVAPPSVPGVEYAMTDDRLHLSMPDNRLHYRTTDDRLHYQSRGTD